MDFIYSIILGIIEGITEYLPISSTAHLLIASELISYFDKTNFLSNRDVRAVFDIVIQVGPIIALLIYFRQDLWDHLKGLFNDQKAQRFWLNIIIAFIPAGIAGILLGKLVENPTLIGAVLVIGGIIFLVVDRGDGQGAVHDVDDITPVQALGIGVAQITALIPGVSRSGATIIGGLLIGLDRKVAARFSFYLSIPTLIIATLYSLYKAAKAGQLTSSGISLLIVGTVVAGVVAYAAIAWFLRYVSTHNFRAFGIYRIIIGVIILLLALFTQVLSS